MTTQLFLDGSVYSPADPFATAMLANGNTIEWVGQDAGARSICDSTMQVIELEGALITPSFSLAAAPARSLAEAWELAATCRAAGYQQLHLFVDGPLAQDVTALVAEPGVLVYLSLPEASEAALEEAHGVYISSSGQMSRHDLVNLAARGKKISLVPASPEDCPGYLDLLEALSPLERMRLSPRIDGLSLIDQGSIDRARALSLTLGFSSHYEASASSFALSLTSGTSVALGSDPLTGPRYLGWELVSKAVNAVGESAVSARAAFQAMTRGPQRAAGASNPMAGQLVPSAPADFALWAVTELMVQTPDSRISAWSTDPRARTPLLPALAPDLDLPQLRALYYRGQKVALDH